MSQEQTWRLAETMACKALRSALLTPPNPPHQHEEGLRLYLAILQACSFPLLFEAEKVPSCRYAQCWLLKFKKPPSCRHARYPNLVAQVAAILQACSLS